MTVAYITGTLSLVCAVVAFMSFRMSRLYRELASLNGLVAAMLRAPDKETQVALAQEERLRMGRRR